MAEQRIGRRWSDSPKLAYLITQQQVALSHDLHALRTHRDWSQDYAASVAGVDPQTILDIEKARLDPRLSTLVRLYFPYDLEAFIGRRPVHPRL
jgi:DNA-binding XRE family transcriptional regulator